MIDGDNDGGGNGEDVDLGPTLVTPSSSKEKKKLQQSESSGPIHRLPARLGRYMLQKRLGVGGMAEVFLAQQDGPAGFQKRCVVKRILPHLAEDERFVQMFQREARIAAMLSHTNIVQIHELGEEDGAFYIAMEYVDGAPLHRLARAAWRMSKPVPLEVVCVAIADAALGLHAAHSQKDESGQPLHLIHRDISPDNLMINREGVTKILDFGIAKSTSSGPLTTTGEVKGKIPFLSPEQIRGDPLDRRADLYALGVTFYWLLTGKRPFSAQSDMALMQAVLTEQPLPPKALNPTVPDAVDALVRRLLEKDRALRPDSGAEIHDALAVALGSRRTIVAPFVEEILSGAEVSKKDDSDDARLAPGFLPSTPHTDEVKAAWKKLVGLEKTHDDARMPRAPTTIVDGAPTLPIEQPADLRARRTMRTPIAAAAGLAALCGIALGVVVLGGDHEHDAGDTTAPPESAAPETAPPVSAAAVEIDRAPPSSALVEEDPPPPPTTAAGAKTAPALRGVDARAPKGVVWQTDKGRVLGSGKATLKLALGTKKVFAVDARRGVKTAMVVGDGPLDYAALPRGKLHPRANPYADVFVGQEALGTTPFPPKDVVVGSYVVRFVYKGKEQKRTVEVKAGETARIAVDFEP